NRHIENPLPSTAKEVASACMINEEILDFNSSEYVVLELNFLSYGDENRELDDLLTIHENTIQANSSLTRWVQDYHQGNISRMDVALAMHAEIEKIAPENDKLIQLRQQLAKYITDQQKISPEKLIKLIKDMHALDDLLEEHKNSIQEESSLTQLVQDYYQGKI